MKLKLENSENIKNIIFDFGGVLLDIDIQLSVDAFEKLNIEGLTKDCIHPGTKGAFLELELGLITPDEFIEQIKSLSSAPDSISEQQIWDSWNVLLLEYDKRRFDLLKKVKECYNISLLSNTNLPHRQYFLGKFENQFGYSMESLFTECVYSDELHCRKPERKIYEIALEKGGLKAEETLFIDDNKINFVGAEELGIRCYHLTGGEMLLDIFE